MSHLLHWLGIDTVNGPAYAFWSGFGSDLGYLAVLGVFWHHMNCRMDGCWRVARHRTHYCRKHGRDAGDGAA